MKIRLSSNDGIDDLWEKPSFEELLDALSELQERFRISK